MGWQRVKELIPKVNRILSISGIGHFYLLSLLYNDNKQK